MKKLITSSLASLFLLSTTATAEVGVNVGVSGSMGLFGATAKEVAMETHTETEIAALAYGSIFIEKTLGDFFTLGIEYVPTPFESETTETAKNDMEPDAQTRTTVVNKLQVDFEDLSTLYIALNVTEDAYVRVGAASVDVITNEVLGTGSSYGNVSLDGTVVGIGYNKDLSNGVFMRGEANYITFDGTSLTSGDNTVTLNSLDGVTAKISIGKSF